ncbi:MAG: HD domain-containing protein [Deltaproteobacteria bacterium]|nr:HD domain-containing protein [Deltaproteobacteria bacterium]
MFKQDMAIFDIYRKLADPGQSPVKIAVILASDDSIKQIGSIPFSQEVEGRLIEKLQGASLVLLDPTLPNITGTSKSEPISEEEEEPADDSELPKSESLLYVKMLFHAATEGSKAVPIPDASFLPVDGDGIVRKYPLMWSSARVLTIPGAILELTKQKVGTIFPIQNGYILESPSGTIHLDEQYCYYLLNPQDKLTVYEYADVLEDKIVQDAFNDTLVLVGYNISGQKLVPIGRDASIPHTLFLAQAINTLVTGRVPYITQKFTVAICSALMALLAAILGMFTSLKSSHKIPAGLIGLLVLMAAFLLLNYLIFNWFLIYLPVLKPFICAPIAYWIIAFFKYRFQERAFKVQTFTIESMLSLSRMTELDKVNSFRDYLTNYWPEMEKWSNIQLITAEGTYNTPEVKAALTLNRQAAEGKGLDILKESITKIGALEYINEPSSKKNSQDNSDEKLTNTIIYEDSGTNKLIIALPDPEFKGRSFVVLSYKGNRSKEVLRGVCAMVLSANAYFKVLDEYKARKNLFLGLIRVIIGAMDAKDPTTVGHSLRVAELSKELATKYGLPNDVVDNVYLGGLLHDVGKLGVPDYILNKPGKLTKDEFKIISSHPSIGHDIMGNIKLPDIIMRAILEHHERLDGKGYPLGLKDMELTLVGKIIKIADVFDALCNKRQYKEPLPHETVYKILKKGIGTEFDWELVNILLKEPFSGPGVMRSEPNEQPLTISSKVKKPSGT